MTDVVDFTDCPLSPRNLEYGGRAGEKRGIVYKGGYWILKFPKSTSGMRKVEGLSYVTSPLSEYLGSHIFQILGYEAHDTVLGVCHDGRRYKPVCACRDFLPPDGSEILIPYTALRNDASPIVMAREDESSSLSASSISEIVFQLSHNAVLSKLKGAGERFWDVALIDILINNNDRNEDNWGVIKNKAESSYRLAPVYDCGNSFYGKSPEERIRLILESQERLYSSALNGITAYEDDEGKHIRNADLVKIDDPRLRDSIRRVYPLVSSKLEEITSFIDDIPAESKGVVLISPERRSLYKKTFSIRLREILGKAFEGLAQRLSV